MLDTPEAFDTEIATIRHEITKLTGRMTVLSEMRAERFGPTASSPTPIVTAVPEASMARSALASEVTQFVRSERVKTAKQVKSLSKRPTSMSKLALSCLRKIGHKGAKRDVLRGYATIARGDLNAASFSATLQKLKDTGKIVLVGGKYYLKSKAPESTETV